MGMVEVFERTKEALTSTKFMLILGLFIGYIIFVSLITVPKVGVIEINGVIMRKETADDVNEMLKYAREERDIKAVVLEINSPGGEATVTTELYLNVLKLRSKKPVVASINQVGASGAYYISAAADYIVAKPGSSIASIGARSSFPEREVLDERSITTGPFKEMGASREDYVKHVEEIKESFLRAVVTQRGDRLKIDKVRLSKGELFLGIDALRYGLIDELGSNEDAYDKAAELAALRNYELVNINEELGISLGPRPVFFVNESLFEKTNTVPVHYFIYTNLG
ncbi:MAG: S49 family peptidase [Candidatus Hydrothermarchaeales archaeon]